MNWTQVVLAIGGAVIGYFLKYYLDLRKTIQSRAVVDKRQHYKTLLLCIKSIREGSTEHSDLLWYEYSFLWLHAPDGVIRSANQLVDLLNHRDWQTENINEILGDLLLEIRKDMGYKRTSLKNADFRGKLPR